MSRSTIVAIAAFLVALGGAIYWQTTSNNATTLPSFGMAEAQEAGEEIDTSGVIEMAIGDENAPVTVIEYASATCPHCKNFHVNTFKQFKTDYIDTGKVHFIYREVYFDRFGLWAGMVARCGGGTDRFFGIMDIVFEEQSTWSRQNTPGEIADALKSIGKRAGLTGAEVDACLQDNDMAMAMVEVFRQNAERDQIRSTPSFLIDGDLVTGDQSYAAFAALIDAKL